MRGPWNQFGSSSNDYQGLNGGYVILGIEDQGGQPILPPHGLDGLDL